MPYGTVNADVIGTSVAGSNLGAGNASSMKNRIINGAMVIDQRNAGASVTITSNSTYTLDRWIANMNQASKFSVQQNAGSVTPPVGFSNYLGVTSLSAYSVGASDVLTIGQYVEGFNTADLGFGTANAKTVTLSFWVRSSLTGTFGGAIRNNANDRSYPFTYTISSANTWTQASVTVAGDTTGTWATGNTSGLEVNFGYGVGSGLSGTANGTWQAGDYRSATGTVSVVGTNGATFYITGVQLEVGSSATGFEYRQYGTELALCQRYFYSCDAKGLYLVGGSASDANGTLVYPVPLRASPTTSGVTINRLTNFAVLDYAGSYTYSAENSVSVNQSAFRYARDSGMTWSTGTPLAINPSGGSSTITSSAEL
jgi:hypothetical protein